MITQWASDVSESLWGSKGCMRTLVSECLTTVLQDQTKKTKRTAQWLNKGTGKKNLPERKQLRIRWQSSYPHFRFTNALAFIIRLANFIVVRWNRAWRNSLINLAQEDIVWVKNTFSFECCQLNMAQAAFILKTPVHSLKSVTTNEIWESIHVT